MRKPLLFAAGTLALLAGLSTAHAQSCEIKVGAMGPMSGGAAQWGLAILNSRRPRPTRTAA